jgi:hypothetical protein
MKRSDSAFLALLATLVSLPGLGCAQTGTQLDEAGLDRWMEFIRPNADENKWRAIGWRTSLRAAIPEAQRLQRPILLWTMNGHPLECT